MLAACGLDAGGMTDDEAVIVAERAGRILHIAVEGMLRILSSRSIAKQEFRIERTAITRGANNPMKFTASADEALRLLLHNNIPGFLPPEDAVREIMRDIQDYQLTLLAGVRSAVEAVLHRLDPATIEAAMPRQTVDALGVVRKAHAWDAFRSAFAQLQQSLSDERGELFGEALGRAYAAHQRRPGVPKEGSTR
jgi:type VI secretion system FHA domain protein